MMKFQKKNPLAFFNFLKEPVLVQKQTIHEQKALDLGFNLTPWKWVWHDQEGATPSRRKKHRSARCKKSYSTAEGRGSLLIMPRPLSVCQIKAEIQGFLLMYRLFLYNNGSFRILKKAGENFSKKIISAISVKMMKFQKKYALVFFNFLKEP